MFDADEDYAATSRTTPDRLIVVSGCSGGGKSSLLREMAMRGWRVAPEPGRQIVREQTLVGGEGVPWQDLRKFVDLCVSRAAHFYHLAAAFDAATLFDRSIVDAVAALSRAGLPVPEDMSRALAVYRYSATVYMVPPWEDLFENDAERRHSFADAVGEYEALLETYDDLGYALEVLPRASIRERADMLDAHIRKRQEVTL
ncbi:AAA family ATPase [Qipengyuania sp.]|uniref:AAA family ATPase n=2 Tax=Qipengyuania sp. TaxID=2004515 RepID=UPI003D1422AE